MLPFAVTLAPGQSPYRQVVYAATKAVVSGELAPGTPFPSVRELSQALKINPNTAHKAVAELIRDGTIEVLPGQGTVVAARPRATVADRRRLLSVEVEQLVVEAKRVGLDEHDVIEAVKSKWSDLFAKESGGKHRRATG